MLIPEDMQVQLEDLADDVSDTHDIQMDTKYYVKKRLYQDEKINFDTTEPYK
jgi:hypothetical protein